ncbi:hypothetical protein [Actinoallomurus sp. NPDC052274]|uniref:Acb2/Tad1 domain-containing protein n=1 Tax=Actinoallomurus sp. NPDC052274 TaxID=3155420 RepID=UPI003448F318
MQGSDIDNRFTYHPPRAGQPAKFEQLRAAARDLAHLINTVCPESREKSLAVTNLEETVMWANASIARHE